MSVAMMLALALGQAAPARDQPMIFFYLEPAEGDPALLRGALPQEIVSWASAADYPAAALAAGERGEARAAVRVDASGAMVDCVPDPSPTPFAGVICPVLKRSARFRYALDRSGRPVADRIALRLRFEPRQLPPAPPALGWQDGTSLELLENRQSMSLTREPDWAGFAPASAGKGDVAVSLFAYNFRPDGSHQLVCNVLGVRQDTVLEDATCRALASAGFRPVGAERTGRMTLLVRWKGRKAGVELPKRARGTPLGFVVATRNRRPGLSGTVRVDLRFPAEGRQPICRVTGSSGSDATDIAACQYFESQPYLPPVDIFGRKVEGRQQTSLSFYS
ncbi:hypothetical protein ACCC88_20135 [Sphingomonas sp. Sphisp140]|uniref:hypothetical protein n=1 Tax=unclassified Sphingomonas TaxID=196159 RepID=UPI0039AF0C33